MLSPTEIINTLDTTKVIYSINDRNAFRIRNGDTLTMYHRYRVVLKYKNRQYTIYVNINSDKIPSLSEKVLLNEIFGQYVAFMEHYKAIKEQRIAATAISTKISVLYPTKDFDKNTAGFQRLYGVNEFKSIVRAYQGGLGKVAEC